MKGLTSNTDSKIFSANDREHLRSEIPARALLLELNQIYAILKAGEEPKYDPFFDHTETRPLSDSRVAQLRLSIDVIKFQLGLVIPSLKPTASPVVLQHDDEQLEPQNIRKYLTVQAAGGLITPDQGKLVAEIAGLKDPLTDDDEKPTEFVINHVMVDARKGSDDDDDGQEPDLGDALLAEDND